MYENILIDGYNNMPEAVLNHLIGKWQLISLLNTVDRKAKGRTHWFALTFLSKFLT